MRHDRRASGRCGAASRRQVRLWVSSHSAPIATSTPEGRLGGACNLRTTSTSLVSMQKACNR
jgi:hypothetical protein